MTTYQSIEEGLPRYANNSDDDKIGLLTRIKRPSQFWKNLLKIIVGAACILVVSWVSLSYFLFDEVEHENEFDWADPNLIIAKTGAVASEVVNCSRFGVEVLKEGGNAVDAAITTHICVGTVNAFAAGIGGGGFMLIRLPNGFAEVVDFREVAPLAVKEDMFVKDHLKAKVGPLSIAVPGELRGLKLAHERHGKLPWKRLLEPSIRISREGFPIPLELFVTMRMYTYKIEHNKELCEIFCDSDGKLKKLGDIMYRTNYSRSLEKVAEDVNEFYEGSIARSTVDTIQGKGGLITMEDLAAYRPTIREPLIGYYQGKKIITSPEPGSGSILLFLLNVLEEYKFHEEGRTSLNYQRLAESLKYAIARRTELGDPAFFKNQTAHKERIKEIISKEYAARIRANITDKRTWIPDHYDPEYATLEDHGTTHISVVDADEMAVSMTATLNHFWGSQVMDSNTGILFNDQMDDFAIPIPPTIERFWPAPHNFPAPGKKPMSSTSPTIIERPDGRFEMAVGASGGTRIMSAVTQTLLNIYEFNMNVLEAIDHPRLYHPLLPNELFIESGFPYDTIDDLIKIGHVVKIHSIYNRGYGCQVQCVRKFVNGSIHAASDFRKNGIAAGY
ncbi:nucleophile aminohydrolase [Gigaspora rosea]|uniref:Glutathione hydrolase n=1 Tax=Gigaspora rosea TaxID=44941 RepID=A0A397VY53_9GLOM|nr:nucleophile aminohydrolase [Gigaspora rosea]